MAAAYGIKIGPKCAVYRNTGTYGSPTWTAITNVRDAQVAIPWDLVEASIRDTRVRLYHPTQIDFAVSLTVRCDDADAGYQALLGAAQEGTTIDMMILDGLVSVEGSAGVRSHFHVSMTGQPQGIGDVLYATFDLKPGFGLDGSSAPAKPKYAVAGAASAMTFSDPG